MKAYKDWSYATRLAIRILVGGLVFIGGCYIITEFITLGPSKFFRQLGVALRYMD